MYSVEGTCKRKQQTLTVEIPRPVRFGPGVFSSHVHKTGRWIFGGWEVALLTEVDGFLGGWVIGCFTNLIAAPLSPCLRAALSAIAIAA